MRFSQKFPTTKAFGEQLNNSLFPNDESYDFPTRECSGNFTNEETHVHRHTAKEKLELMETLLSESKCAAGTFKTDDDAWDAIREILLFNRDSIYEWLKSVPSDDYTKSKKFSANVGSRDGESSLGEGFIRNPNGSITSYKTDVASVIIVPEPRRPAGFAVKTAFPGTNDKLDPCKGMVLSRENVKETLEKTDYYKHADKEERAVLDYLCENHKYGAKYIPGYNGYKGKIQFTIKISDKITDDLTFSTKGIRAQRKKARTMENRYNDEIKYIEPLPIQHPFAYGTKNLDVFMDRNTFDTAITRTDLYPGLMQDIAAMRKLLSRPDPQMQHQMSEINKLTANIQNQYDGSYDKPPHY